MMKVDYKTVRYFRSTDIFGSSAHRKLRERVNNLDLTQFSTLSPKQYEAMLGFLKLSAKDRILDVGCGVGRIAYDVHERTGASVVAVDKNHEVLVPGIERYGNTIEFHELDFIDMDFPPGSFDAIYCIDSLFLSKEWDSVLYNLLQILKNTGRMAIFWSTKVNPEEDPTSLKPRHTRLAKELQKYQLKTSHIDFTQEASKYWNRTLEALEELEEEFQEEGEGNLVISFRHEATHILPYINDNRYSRYLYLIRKP